MRRYSPLLLTSASQNPGSALTCAIGFGRGSLHRPVSAHHLNVKLRSEHLDIVHEVAKQDVAAERGVVLFTLRLSARNGVPFR